MLMQRICHSVVLPTAILLASLSEPIFGQVRPTEVPVSALSKGELTTFWHVRRASLREDLTGTTSYLVIENTSKVSLEDFVIYGEYFDSAGRLCFSSMFSRSAKENSIAPAEYVTLSSRSGQLFAASDVRNGEFYLVQQRISGQPDSLRRWKISIRAPVTIRGTSMRLDEDKLQLAPDTVIGSTPLDLLLARVKVDQSGSIQDIETLNKLANQTESWFREFVSRRKTNFFNPATVAGLQQSDLALIMIRAVSTEVRSESVSYQLRASLPWVKSFAAGLSDKQIPPITEILFHRPPTRVKAIGNSDNYIDRPAAPPGVMELMYLGSDWSLSDFDGSARPPLSTLSQRESK